MSKALYSFKTQSFIRFQEKPHSAPATWNNLHILRLFHKNTNSKRFRNNSIICELFLWEFELLIDKGSHLAMNAFEWIWIQIGFAMTEFSDLPFLWTVKGASALHNQNALLCFFGAFGDFFFGNELHARNLKITKNI